MEKKEVEIFNEARITRDRFERLVYQKLKIPRVIRFNRFEP